MPGNCLALSVRVSCEVERVGILQRLYDCVNVFLVSLYDLLFHREGPLGVDRAFFGHEVANMTI